MLRKSFIVLTLGDGFGDKCQTDKDGDKIPDFLDASPYNKKIYATNFKRLQKFLINPFERSGSDPSWYVDAKVRLLMR